MGDSREDTIRKGYGAFSSGDGPFLVIDYDVPKAEVKVTVPILTAGQLTFHWTDTQPPYQVQTRSTITAEWINVGAPQSGTETTVPTDGNQAYFRVIETQPNVQ